MLENLFGRQSEGTRCTFTPNVRPARKRKPSWKAAEAAESAEFDASDKENATPNVLVPSAPGKKTRGAPPSKSGTGPVVSGINFESPIAYVKTMGLPEEVLHTAERIIKASPDDLGDVQQCLRGIIHGGYNIDCHEACGEFNRRMKTELGDVMNSKFLGKFHAHFGEAMNPTTT